MSRCEMTLSPEYPVRPSLLKSAFLAFSDSPLFSKLLPGTGQPLLQARAVRCRLHSCEAVLCAPMIGPPSRHAGITYKLCPEGAFNQHWTLVPQGYTLCTLLVSIGI